MSPKASTAPPVEHIGAALGELRRSLGVTQVELQERTGMPQEQISKLERRSDVKLSTLRKYLEGLDAGDVEFVVSDGELIVSADGKQVSLRSG